MTSLDMHDEQIQFAERYHDSDVHSIAASCMKVPARMFENLLSDVAPHQAP